MGRWCWMLLAGLLLLTATASAHIAGATYTSVWVARSGVLLEYTVPADSLMELNAIPGEPARLGPARYYAGNIVDGFALSNDGAPCTATVLGQRELKQIGSYQYTLQYRCASPPRALRIDYRVFPQLPPSHENFADVHVGTLKLDRVLAARQPLLHIDLDALAAQSSFAIPAELPSSTATTPSSLHLLKLGFQHILEGADHIVFVLTLLFVAMARRELLLLVTLFTLAHSVTLALAGLDLVTVDVRLAEILIALSIIYVAIENVLHLRTHQDAPSRSILLRRRISVFVFGLVHGFGFSFVLKEIGLPRESLLQSLLAFNVGIEGGQLLVLVLALPLVALGWKTLSYHRTSIAASAVAGAIGVYWLIGRL
jgi:hypothetical protein